MKPLICRQNETVLSLIILAAIGSIEATTAEEFGEELFFQVPKTIREDAELTTPQLLMKYKYPAQIHQVQTDDGYILEMHRIPRPGAIPVFLQHGIMDSSAGWIIMGPHSALGYYLYDLGYDVWLGNNRGNRYSRNHIKLSPRKAEFWDFSFNEIGTQDLPTMIDYVLKNTKFSKLHYIGHSQGTAAFWVMCSERPQYCNKIISMQALAPIAYLEHSKSPLVKAIAPFANTIGTVTSLMNIHEFLPNTDLMRLAGQAICHARTITQVLCTNMIFLASGFNSEQLNKTMLPAIFGHFPAGTSTKQFLHFAQLVNSKQFRKFDNGYLKNLAAYKSMQPPKYDLKKVTAPVALHFSDNDWLSDVKDVQRLAAQLPNVYKRHLIVMPEFNHLDFLFAIRSRELVYDEVVRSMKAYETKV